MLMMINESNIGFALCSASQVYLKSQPHQHNGVVYSFGSRTNLDGVAHITMTPVASNRVGTMIFLASDTSTALSSVSGGIAHIKNLVASCH